MLWCGLTKAVRCWERFELKVTRDCIRYSPQYDDRMYEKRAVYVADSLHTNTPCKVVSQIVIICIVDNRILLFFRGRAQGSPHVNRSLLCAGILLVIN